MQDFILRCQFFLSTATRPLSDVRLQGLWLGGLLQPEACVTAMRQLAVESPDVAPTVSWKTSLATSAESWLQQLLTEVPPLQLSATQLRNPLHRYLNREVSLVRQLQNRVVEDLKSVLGVCTAQMKSTQPIRRLLRELSEDRIPEAWTDWYVTPPSQSGRRERR